MTKEEAIAMVRSAFSAWESEYDCGDDWSKQHKARDMAIEALKRDEVILCKDCKHHRNRTGRCDVWSANTDADGHCYKAKRNGK